MLSFCLKYKENAESKIPRVSKTTRKENECFYQTVRFTIVKNQDLSKSKKQKAC